MRKISFSIISVCLLFLVACSGNQDQDKLVQLKNRIDKMATKGYDVDSVKTILGLLNFEDKVLLDGKTNYALDSSLSKTSFNENSLLQDHLYIDVGFPLHLKVSNIKMSRIKLKAGKITKKRFNNFLNESKKDYLKKRDEYITKINQYLDTLSSSE